MTKDMSGSQYLGFANLYNVIAEMRTPLLELQMLNQAGDLKASQEIANQLLALFNSFLYAQQLEKGASQLHYLPYSLPAATEGILEKMKPFAQLYGVQLEFQTDKPKQGGVSLVKQAFDHATQSLLHSLISSLQNNKAACLRVKVSHRGCPTLQVFSRDTDLNFHNKLNSLVTPKLKLNSACSGLGSGLMLANLIYRRVGSQLNFSSNQHGWVLKVNFKLTQQMTLMESLL